MLICIKWFYKDCIKILYHEGKKWSIHSLLESESYGWKVDYDASERHKIRWMGSVIQGAWENICTNYEELRALLSTQLHKYNESQVSIRFYIETMVHLHTQNFQLPITLMILNLFYDHASTLGSTLGPLWNPKTHWCLSALALSMTIEVPFLSKLCHEDPCCNLTPPS